MQWLHLLAERYEVDFKFQAFRLGLVPRFGEESINCYLDIFFATALYAVLMTMFSIIYGQGLGKGAELFALIVLLHLPPFDHVLRYVLYTSAK